MIDMPPMDYHRTAEAIVRCGVSASRVRIRFEREFKLDIVTIERLAEFPSEALLTCIHAATVPAGYQVQFADPGQNNAFSNLVMTLALRSGKLEARQWLRDRDLLDGLPHYEPGISSPAAFARQLESHCSLEPDSVLAVVDETLFTLRNAIFKAVRGPDAAAWADKFSCLMKSMAASNLAESGLRFGFIGNEARPGKGNRR